MDYCRLLSQKDGFVPAQKNIKAIDSSPKAVAYRLPTEAEWEFACRAGTITRYLWGDDAIGEEFEAIGWAGFNSGNVPHPVEELNENPFGLFDCYGNVAEWCYDRWKENAYQQIPENQAVDPVVSVRESEAHVLRGGSAQSNWTGCSSPSRFGYGDGGSNHSQRFASALSIDAVKQALTKKGGVRQPHRLRGGVALSICATVEISVAKEKRTVQFRRSSPGTVSAPVRGTA